jgi:hypothetical protein
MSVWWNVQGNNIHDFIWRYYSWSCATVPAIAMPSLKCWERRRMLLLLHAFVDICHLCSWLNNFLTITQIACWHTWIHTSMYSQDVPPPLHKANNNVMEVGNELWFHKLSIMLIPHTFVASCRIIVMIYVNLASTWL